MKPEQALHDGMGSNEFEKQYLLAMKILYIFIIILIIMGNTLVLLTTWGEREKSSPTN